MEHGRHIPNMVLKKSRQDSDFSQLELAEKIGMQKSGRIYEWEKGISDPTIRNAFRLKHVLKKSVDELFSNIELEVEKEMIELEKLSLLDQSKNIVENIEESTRKIIENI